MRFSFLVALTAACLGLFGFTARTTVQAQAVVDSSRELGAKKPVPDPCPAPRPRKRSRDWSKLSPAQIERIRARIRLRRAIRRAVRRAKRRAARRGRRRSARRTPARPRLEGWTPQIGQSWNYNLNSPVSTDADVDVVFIDMDDSDVIDTLHDQGKAVVCYISIGTWEDWREDADKFPESSKGNSVDGTGVCEGSERWIDITNKQVWNIMKDRVRDAARMNCDAIEPNAMMNYEEENTGFDVSERQQVAYNERFAKLVHHFGMFVGLKNAVGLLDSINIKLFDFALNLECFAYQECEGYEDTFLDANKPVFNVEFEDTLDHCQSALTMGFNSITKNADLGAPFCSCSCPDNDLQCENVMLAEYEGELVPAEQH